MNFLNELVNLLNEPVNFGVFDQRTQQLKFGVFSDYKSIAIDGVKNKVKVIAK